MHQTNLLDLFWEGFQLTRHHLLGDQQLLLVLAPDAPPCCSGWIGIINHLFRHSYKYQGPFVHRYRLHYQANIESLVH